MAQGGIEELLQAAQYIEQQEKEQKLKRSPLTADGQLMQFLSGYSSESIATTSNNNNSARQLNRNNQLALAVAVRRLSTTTPPAISALNGFNDLTNGIAASLSNGHRSSSRSQLIVTHDYENSCSGINSRSGVVEGATGRIIGSEDGNSSLNFNSKSFSQPQKEQQHVATGRPATTITRANEKSTGAGSTFMLLSSLPVTATNSSTSLAVGSTTTSTPPSTPMPTLKHKLATGVGCGASEMPRKVFVLSNAKTVSPTAQANLAVAAAGVGAGDGYKISRQKPKSQITLTPPPTATRRVEPHARIRSYSMPSNKLSAQMEQGALIGGSRSEDAHMSYVGAERATSATSAANISATATGTLYCQHYQHPTSAATVSSSAPAAGSQLIGHGNRRRTISSNSNGVGTREVHNKLEKNRRAHLKSCYEVLKNELRLKEEDRKKTSNLTILDKAHRLVMQLSEHGQNQEVEMEILAKQKIELQKRLNSLKRPTDQIIPFNGKDVNEADCLATTSSSSSSSSSPSLSSFSSSSLSLSFATAPPILYDGTSTPVSTTGVS